MKRNAQIARHGGPLGDTRADSSPAAWIVTAMTTSADEERRRSAAMHTIDAPMAYITWKMMRS
jgi:hypothetical protein